MLTRVVKMQFNPSFIEEFKSVFKLVQSKIEQSEGCTGVKLLQDEKDSSIFFTISNWESENALEVYRNSELFKLTWAKVKPNFTRKAEAWSLLEY
jgi:heme-degrading monooxygenase HmoA